MWMINCILLMVGAVVATLGISFYAGNKEVSGKFRFYIFFYGICSAIWCISYGFIGITDDFAACEIIRKVGILGIDAFLVTEVFFGVAMAGIKRKTAAMIRTGMVFLSILDYVVFAHDHLDIYIRHSAWTTWQANPEYDFNRAFHGVYCAISFLVLFTLGIVWGKNNPLKRFRRFLSMFFGANFLMLFISLPDTLLPAFGMSAVPMSGLGGATCALVMWYGATQLSSFDIRMGNLRDKLFDFLEAGVIVFDVEQKITMINPYSRKLAGREPWDGYQLSDFFDLDLDIKEAMFEKAAKGIYTTRLWDKEKKKAYSVRMKSVEDDYGEVFCYMCIFMDVTEEVEAATKLQIASQAKSRFLAQMSHEIRTPINAVLGMNEMILRESKEEEILEYSESIDSAGKTLLSLINSILDFSKIEDGKMDIIPVRYDTASFINDLINSVSQRAEAKGLALWIEVDETLPCAMIGDDVRFSQVIVNLLTNAVKYTEKGSVTLTLKAKERDEEKVHILVAVKDTGIGIKEKDICRLFESFERLDEVRNRNIEGTGLGITIIKNLLDMMGSRLCVESHYGEGSTFSFTITQKIADATPVGDYEKRLKDSMRQRKPEDLLLALDARILLVDDNDMNLKVAKNLLKLCGIKPDMVSSGEQAIEAMREHMYDIVFLDHMMPGLDGIETLHKMREENLIPETTVMIALTANAVVGAREKYLEEGFADYLSKPIELRQLIHILQSYLPKEALVQQESAREEKERKDQTIVPEQSIQESEILEFGPESFPELLPQDDPGEVPKIPEQEASEDVPEPPAEEAWEDVMEFPAEEMAGEEKREYVYGIERLQAEGIHTEEGLKYCAGDEALYFEMLNEFAAACSEKAREMEQFYQKQDWHGYEVLVHAAKSNTRMLGAFALSERARMMEEAAKQEDPAAIENGHREMLTQYEKLAETIRLAQLA